MKTKVSPAVVGLFVLGALVLGLVALFSFGGINFFSKPERFVVYFDESVHGLDLGSPVKLRGVRVGRVVDIGLRYEPATGGSLVAVSCELNRNLIADGKGGMIDVTEDGKLQQLVDRGMRAQLGVIGYATGLLYVEIDFLDPVNYPATPRPDLVSKYVEMPAVPSKSAELLRSLDEILTNIKGVDLAALSREVQGLVADTRKKINGLDTDGLIAEWTKAGASMRGLAESPEVKQTLVNLGAASGKLDAILADYAQNGPKGEAMTQTLTEIRATITTFNSTVATAQKFINAQQSLGDDASQALIRLGEAASAVRELADYLERNPSALITGRKQPTPPPAK
ncbi:MlaD family protein [Rariglobus hedericola]|uniref:MCE family protein n=1 Tax=Rariglobus hedericola TaxID=2597822 RepID=A0A556QSL5_9BACT|nr:MlaD family protein [Rariglobus hedericola]TSJ79634.1 MCE family protein [Rariglobus hedericola]